MEFNEIKQLFQSIKDLSDDTKSTDRNTYGFGKYAQLDKNRNSKGWVRAEYIILEDDCIDEADIESLKTKWSELRYEKDGSPYGPQNLIFNSNDGWHLWDHEGNDQQIPDVEKLNIQVNRCVSSTAAKNKEIDIKNTLLENKNLILTGAPGTGKTFLARNIAASIIGDCSWEVLPKELKSHCGFVQFHPSYDYSDFVEGLRPTKDGAITFDRMDGVFKGLCKRASEDPKRLVQRFKEVYSGKKLSIPYVSSKGSFTVHIEKDEPFRITIPKSKNTQSATDSDIAESILTGKQIKNRTYSFCIAMYIANEMGYGKPYVFIIDEINRGELSKIFGELFFAIDPGYRGEAGRINTQYQNLVPANDVFSGGFYVPENVYIIGTMNDIDRGVESMDFAIRRRFAWQEITAKDSADSMGIDGIAREKMDAVNAAIISDSIGLTTAYQIGGAYFLKRKGDSKADFDELWKYHLNGIISEYFRGEPDGPTKIAEIKKAYDEAKVEGAE